MNEETKVTVGVINSEDVEVTISGLAKISKEIKESVATVSGDQVRFLVDAYYQTQDFRKAVDNQARAVKMGVDGEGTDKPLSIVWLGENIKAQEVEIKKMLDIYTSNNPVGRWAKSITGIGPVIAAGLIAGFDIKKCCYATQFLSYAGLNDYNNPWLGTEKANKLVNDFLRVHDEKMEALEQHVLSAGKTEKDLKKYGALAAEYNLDLEPIVLSILDGTGEPTTDKQYETVGMVNELASMLPSPRADVADFMFHCMKHSSKKLYAKRYFTMGMLQRIAPLAHRNMKVITNGIRNKESEELDNTKKALCAYLAKPPYNKSLQLLCWKAGDSFRKQSGREKSLYGRLYRERKARDIQKNEEGGLLRELLRSLPIKIGPRVQRHIML